MKIKKVLKLPMKILFWVFGLLLVIICFIAFMALISYIHEKLFVPRDYILWTFNSPLSSLIFIFEVYFILSLFKYIRSDIINFMKNRRWVFYGFILANVILIYALIFNVSAISSNRIVNYSFFSPQGKSYAYSDITKIDTGIYTQKRFLPSTPSRGDFYYILTLKDGTTIDLNDVGGVPEDKDIYLTYEELDQVFVKKGIPKISKPETFQYFDTHLDKIYRDRIRNVLNNR